MKRTAILFFSIAIIICTSCENNETADLAPVEERVSEAISNLRDELTAPENGWKLEYQPTNTSGSFYMLLNFDKDGNVNIKSDVAANDGEFFDETITYRIDNAHGLELVLETYAVFHYMFEQNAASFGAEFEFIYKEKDGDNLVFESASDQSDPTQLIFEPAESNAENALSRDESKNLDAFSGLLPNNYVLIPILQQVILEDQNISVFWSIYPTRRIIDVDIAGVGTNAQDIFASNDNYIGISHETGYTLKDGKLILKSALTFPLDGKQFEIGEISLNEFDMSADPLCPSNTEMGPKYKGQIPGLGSASIINTYYSSSGDGFQPGYPYSVNVFFVSDAEGNSLSENGIIQERYPTASGFYFIYDIDPVNDSIPGNSVGLVLEDGSLHLRGFEATTTELNKVKVTLTNDYYFSNGSTSTKIDNLNAVTDEIFEGGELYAYEYPIQGLTVWDIFNSCNGYEFLMVE